VKWIGLPVAVLCLVVTMPLGAQQDSLARAFDLERRGNYADAAAIYRAVLARNPAEITALLGLERSLEPLNREAELLPAARAALAADPRQVPAYGVALRTFAALNQLDSLPPLVDRWAQAAPGDESPYREWATAALMHRDRAMARHAYETGRARLGREDALSPEMAQLAVLDGEWTTAVREWARACRQLPGYKTSAISSLAGAPDSAHAGILQAFDREPGADVARIGIELRARWGDPVGALDRLLKALPAGPGQQVDALQAFLEETGARSTPEYELARGRVLEALAERWTVASQRARLRLESAQAYASAGDGASARRMLAQVGGDSAGAEISAGATTTLIDLLVADGKAEEAEQQLAQHRGSLPVDEYLRLRRAVALHWALAGRTEHAESLVAADSSVEALALEGRIRLYAGDLKATSELWRAAGPFAGTREEATDRSVILGLIQPIEADTVAALGAAFLTLDRGDTLAAAAAFRQAAQGLPPDGGRAEITLFAGQLFAAAGRKEAAETAFHDAVLKQAPGPSAAAMLELGRLLLAEERREEATHALEQMILDYPTSALLPQARRLLDQARGAIPRT